MRAQDHDPVALPGRRELFETGRLCDAFEQIPARMLVRSLLVRSLTCDQLSPELVQRTGQTKAGMYDLLMCCHCGLSGDQNVDHTLPDPPLYLQLGIDLDAPHEIPDLDLKRQPSAEKGANLGLAIPPKFLTLDYYRAHSPREAWEDLRDHPITNHLDEAQIWDLVAWAYQQNTDSATLAAGETLYQRDCAACHGVEGLGNGVFGADGNEGHSSPNETGIDGHSFETPTNFQDLEHMLSASPALLQGKIIRGGMGTGMPSWGLIYTEEQTWALVNYLWSFVFDDFEE